MTRVLAIDYGTVRHGIAVSDDLGMLAHPLETVPAANESQSFRRIAQIVQERRIEIMVLGIPVRLNGVEGTAAARVRAWGAKLRAALPESLHWEEVDECLTTASAAAKLREAGRSVKQSRAIIDQAAAVEILQIFLDRQAPLLPWPDEDDEEDYLP